MLGIARGITKNTMKALLKYVLSASIIGTFGGPTQANGQLAQHAFGKLSRFYEDIQAGRLEAAMALYAADAQVILPGQSPVVGKEAIRAWWAGTLSAFEFRLTPELTEAADLAGAVMLRGRTVGSLISKKDGSVVPVDIWFMQIYRREPDGSYLFWRGASGANPSR